MYCDKDKLEELIYEIISTHAVTCTVTKGDMDIDGAPVFQLTLSHVL